MSSQQNGADFCGIDAKRKNISSILKCFGDLNDGTATVASQNTAAVKEEETKEPPSIYNQEVASRAEHEQPPQRADQFSTSEMPPQNLLFDEQEELKRIEMEKAKGKGVFVGNLILNEPDKIIGVSMDNFGELLYLVTYQSSDKEVYTPTWVHSWLISQINGDLIDDYLRRQMVPFSMPS